MCVRLPTSLFVPTSRTTGRHCWGGIPPIAVYNDNFPQGIPIPKAPRSPKPRIRSPSVTTTAWSWSTYVHHIPGIRSTQVHISFRESKRFFIFF